MARKPIPVIQRLLAKIDRCGECWIWQGTKNGAGYGTIGAGSRVQGKAFVHRISYEHFHGPIPEGHVVCHKCDVRLCVNPDHLFSGTQRDNVNDAMSKGRVASGERWHRGNRDICTGERHGMAKLSEDAVIEIFNQFKAGRMNKRQIAEQFGVCRATVRNIVKGKNWKHLQLVNEN